MGTIIIWSSWEGTTKGLVFQGPQSSPKSHPSDLRMYINHFGNFINLEKAFKISGHFIFIHTAQKVLWRQFYAY